MLYWKYFQLNIQVPCLHVRLSQTTIRHNLTNFSAAMQQKLYFIQCPMIVFLFPSECLPGKVLIHISTNNVIMKIQVFSIMCLKILPLPILQFQSPSTFLGMYHTISHIPVSKSMSVSYGFYNKPLQAWWLRRTQVYFLTVMEARSPTSVSLSQNQG